MEQTDGRARMIIQNGKETCALPSEGILGMLRKKYSILIIGLLRNEKEIRFNMALEGIGKTRANRLSIRLRRLETLGLMERKVEPWRSFSFEYSLTARGLDSENVIFRHSIELNIPEFGESAHFAA
ncbi:MAG: winged helix-turn-helix transcriptional regulator, partial [Candidatus Thermoplasmatota archaeon]|nr:winged helix-turn-helix transcriptional regulator [Candidatus Thermoplasmatota archaeon]